MERGESLDTILEMEHMSKTYPGVRALDDVSLRVGRGTVHALMGENGAGKSTLMKILFGMTSADAGSIRLNGQPTVIRSTADAMSLGISMIHQELNPILDLSIAENIFVGRYPRKGGVVDRREMAKQSLELFAQWNLSYDPKAAMRSLKTADMQMVEIIKAISFGAKLIIMDEPSSSITEREVAQLFRFIRELREKGITIIMITHKLDEVFQVADQATVLRDGQVIGTHPIEELDRDKLVSMMVGREIKEFFIEREKAPGEVLLSVAALNRGRKVQDVGFELRRGEILGFGGIIGAGRTETMRCLFGLDRARGGSITLEDRPLTIKSPQDAIRNGILMATESRKDDGLVLCRSVLENIMLPSVSTGFGRLIRKKAERKTARQAAERLSVRAPSLSALANTLSGGNQQKLILSKWLLMNPKVLILDEPTRGIDVGAKTEIYGIMSDLARQGIGILLVSSDMEELIGMSDRVVVMCEGRVNAILEDGEIEQSKIMHYASEVM